METPLTDHHLEPNRLRWLHMRSHWLPLIVIFSVFMLGNALLPFFLWWPHSGRWIDDLIMVLNGVLVSEVGILGIWSALGSDRWPHRLLHCGVLLGLLTTCWLIGLQLPEVAELPSVVAWIICGIALVGWLSTWLVLGFLRACFGWYIGSTRAAVDDPPRAQISMVYLFAAVTSVAVLIAALKAVLPSADNLVEMSEVRPALIAVGFYILYCLMLLIPCCGLVLKKRTPYWLIPVLLLELYFLGGLTIAGVTWIMNLSPFSASEVTAFYKFSFGFVASTMLVLGVLRACGYQLCQARHSRPAA